MRGPLATLALAATVELRRAGLEDLPDLVALLAADPLGSSREAAHGDLTRYQQAFHAITADPAHLLVVAVHKGVVVGTLQLSVIPGLARRGALRGQIEGVRVHPDYRGRGLGTAVLEWTIAEARSRGCALVQLTRTSSAPARIASTSTSASSPRTKV